MILILFLSIWLWIPENAGVAGQIGDCKPNELDDFQYCLTNSAGRPGLKSMKGGLDPSVLVDKIATMMEMEKDKKLEMCFAFRGCFEHSGCDTFGLACESMQNSMDTLHQCHVQIMEELLKSRVAPLEECMANIYGDNFANLKDTIMMGAKKRKKRSLMMYLDEQYLLKKATLKLKLDTAKQRVLKLYGMVQDRCSRPERRLDAFNCLHWWHKEIDMQMEQRSNGILTNLSMMLDYVQRACKGQTYCTMMSDQLSLPCMNSIHDLKQNMCMCFHKNQFEPKVFMDRVKECYVERRPAQSMDVYMLDMHNTTMLIHKMMKEEHCQQDPCQLRDHMLMQIFKGGPIDTWMGMGGSMENGHDGGGKPVPKPSEWVHVNEDGKLGPDQWWQEYPHCNGVDQSPIDLDNNDVIVNASLPDIKFGIRYKQVSKNMKLENMGATLEVKLEGDKPTISGGLMGDTEYDLLQFHLHWGPTDGIGSEHSLANQYVPLEIHFVHMKKGLNMEQALNDRTGLSVLALFFDVTGKSGDKVLKSVIDNAAKVEYNHTDFDLPPMWPLFSMFPVKKDFVTYLGSLTTPPCNEAVIWTIFTEIQSIDSDQLQVLRQLKRVSEDKFTGKPNEYIVQNFRPSQHLNGRRLQANKPQLLP